MNSAPPFAVAVGPAGPAARRAHVLLVVAAPEVAHPAPLLGAHEDRRPARPAGWRCRRRRSRRAAPLMRTPVGWTSRWVECQSDWARCRRCSSGTPPFAAAAPARDEVVDPLPSGGRGSTATLASFGSLPVTRLPFVLDAVAGVGEPAPCRRPAGRRTSRRRSPRASCGPRRPSPSSRSAGWSSSARRRPWRESAMKLSAEAPAVALSPGMLSKYQSEPLVVGVQLPVVAGDACCRPSGGSGALSACSWAGVAQLTP